MSADLGPGPEENRHNETMEVLGEIAQLLRELTEEMRATRIALDHEGALLRQAIKETRR